MTDQPQTAIARNVERCRERDGMSERDAEAILEVHQRLQLLGPSEVSESYHSDLLMRSVKLAREVGGLVDSLEDREAAEEIVRWIHDTYDNEETNRDYRKTLRAFARHATDSETPPDSISWVPAGYSSTYDPAPDPAEMYHWDQHVKPMIDACQNARDEALIALCWDLGPRTSELHELTVGNISEGDWGLKVTIENGKNGSRSPTIVKSVPYVRGWLERHPGDNGDYLWSLLNKPERISRNGLRDAIKRAADRAKMVPPSTPTPTRFRKSSASYLASQNVNQAFLEEHHGWTTGSTKAARYITVFGDESDRAIAAAHGVDVEVEDDDPGMIECVRCETLNEGSRLRCRTCDQALSQEAAEKEAVVDDLKDRIDELLIGADSPNRRRELVASKTALDDRANELELEDVHRLLSSGDT